MVYVQRRSGIFIRQNMIPQADLQAESTFPDGQYIEPGIHQVLSYMTGQNAAGPRMLQADSNGRLNVSTNGGYVTQPPVTQQSLIAPRTDTATFLSADIATPNCTILFFGIRITAVSGTSPTLTLVIWGKDTQGLHGAVGGSSATSALNSVTSATLSFTASATAQQSIMSPFFQVEALIGGTTPSFTWYLDMMYK